MRTLALATLLTLLAVAAACGGGPSVAVPDATAAPTEDPAAGQDPTHRRRCLWPR